MNPGGGILSFEAKAQNQIGQCVSVVAGLQKEKETVLQIIGDCAADCSQCHGRSLASLEVDPI